MIVPAPCADDRRPLADLAARQSLFAALAQVLGDPPCWAGVIVVGRDGPDFFNDLAEAAKCLKRPRLERGAGGGK
jgi:hypothetical protein